MNLSRKTWALAIGVILAAGLLYGFLYFQDLSSEPGRGEPADPQIFYEEHGIIANQRAEIPVFVENQAGFATGLILVVESTAFDRWEGGRLDYAAGDRQEIRPNLQIMDTTQGWHDVTFTVEFTDVNGRRSVQFQSRVYVIPQVEIEFRWQTPFRLPPVDQMGVSDEIIFFFKIESKSTETNYTRLRAEIEVVDDPFGVVIDPSSFPLKPIGPEGVSEEQTIEVRSQDSPPGTYDIIIRVYSDQFVAAEYQDELTILA